MLYSTRHNAAQCAAYHPPFLARQSPATVIASHAPSQSPEPKRRTCKGAGVAISAIRIGIRSWGLPRRSAPRNDGLCRPHHCPTSTICHCPTCPNEISDSDVLLGDRAIQRTLQTVGWVQRSVTHPWLDHPVKPDDDPESVNPPVEVGTGASFCM